METLFAASSFLVMPFWLLMIVAPRWRVTARLAASPFIVAGPVLLYAALVVPELLALLPAVARPDLPTIAALLGTPRGATIAWAHFLALDLFAARWIFLDAREKNTLPAWVVSPLLLLTLLFGPLGLGVYLALGAVQPGSLRALGRDVWKGSRPLALLALGSLGLVAASLALMAIDPRQVTGVSAWLKPAKFGASVALTAPVLAWIAAQLRDGRLLRFVTRSMTAMLALELVIITVQAARGVPSHFNASSGLNVALFAIMGAAISLFWLGQGVMTVLAFRRNVNFRTPARTWAIRLGLAISLLGGGLGFRMTRPTADQLEHLRAGEQATLIGAHSVGVRDGGPGLPVTRWSTTGGDVRVPHFFGLHALQALPLLALFLERRRRTSARPVVAAGVGWLGLVVVTLGQALRGQPLTSPDALTLGAAAALLVLTVAIATLRLPQPAESDAPAHA